jgi:hypothetical protein
MKRGYVLWELPLYSYTVLEEVAEEEVAEDLHRQIKLQRVQAAGEAVEALKQVSPWFQLYLGRLIRSLLELAALLELELQQIMATVLAVAMDLILLLVHWLPLLERAEGPKVMGMLIHLEVVLAALLLRLQWLII